MLIDLLIFGCALRRIFYLWRFVALQKDQKAANSRNIHIVVVVVGDVANALPYVALREQSPSYWAQTLEK